ncbi:TIGR02302 family protein [Microbaculum sp. FT89]|uniref:TIGR02302 family protein n=1 Tax=Microbaculum sp. FT89 TaxID=3447298 RepID=UPI003F536018
MADSRERRSDAGDKATSARRLIQGAIRRAAAAIAFERLWPALLPAVTVIAVYCIVSWLGLWISLPPYIRLGGLALFVLAFLASLWPLARLRLPRPGEARHRVETATGLSHRPLTALEDRLAGTHPSGAAADAATERLWAAHRARAAAGIGRLSAGMPAPRVAARDPYALRAIVVLLFVVSLAWAGPDWGGRLLSAAAPVGPDEAQIARIDAWVSPPRYTGRPPVLLTGSGARREEGLGANGAAPAPISVPQGSQLVIRAPADAGVAVAAAFGTAESAPVPAADVESAATAPAEYQIALDENGSVNVSLDGHQALGWRFEVIADRPPSIAFAHPPDFTATQALRLNYTVSDDYGVVGADARFEPLDPRLADADPLVPPPDFPLSLPQLRARSGAAQTIKELSSHPWAGSKVRLRLVARDDAGHEGLSDPVEITLPQRRFYEPLARAIVEQRRNLALDRNAVPMVAGALDALALEPEKNVGDYGVYLGMRSAFWRLRAGDGSEETLRGVIDQLWEVALQIEDGDLSLAAEDLRAAQERLMQALENGASDEEIEQLMAELREALDEFLRELAQRAMENQDQAQQMPMDPNAQTFSRNDLQRLLDAIENMARSGARDSARQMLSDLRNLLENLRNGRMQPGQMQSGPMGEMLDELADLIRRQQELMDQTFQLDQQGQQPGQGERGQGERGQGQQGEGQQGQGGDQLGQLGQGQGELREALRQLMEKLKELGGQPGNELGQAGEAMGEAEQSLGLGDTGDALDQQGRALDNLRRGAQSMAEALAQGMAQGMGMGQPGPNGRQRTDPFGRPLRTEGPDYGVTVKVPDEIDAQRAREILEELRRRLSDPLRPRLEKDYLERLLERF